MGGEGIRKCQLLPWAVGGGCGCLFMLPIALSLECLYLNSLKTSRALRLPFCIFSTPAFIRLVTKQFASSHTGCIQPCPLQSASFERTIHLIEAVQRGDDINSRDLLSQRVFGASIFAISEKHGFQSALMIAIENNNQPALDAMADYYKVRWLISFWCTAHQCAVW